MSGEPPIVSCLTPSSRSQQAFKLGTDGRRSRNEHAAARKTLGWKTPIEVLDQFFDQRYENGVSTTG
jgi:hypothetical protein